MVDYPDNLKDVVVFDFSNTKAVSELIKACRTASNVDDIRYLIERPKFTDAEIQNTLDIMIGKNGKQRNWRCYVEHQGEKIVTVLEFLEKSHKKRHVCPFCGRIQGEG